jgi:hypothetical protein
VGRKRGKCWSKEEEEKLVSLMDAYIPEDNISSLDYLRLVAEEMKRLFNRDVELHVLKNRYRAIKGKYKDTKIVDDGIRYVLIMHINGDLNSGTTLMCRNRKELANKLAEYANKYGGELPKHTILGRIKFEIILNEVEA